MNRGLLLLLACALLPGCASVRTLDAAKPGAPIIYSGTRLDWYTLQGGCCPVDRFGAEAPRIRVLGRKVSNGWANLETLGAGIGDSLYGFRVYPIAPLVRLLP